MKKFKFNISFCHKGISYNYNSLYNTLIEVDYNDENIIKNIFSNGFFLLKYYFKELYVIGVSNSQIFKNSHNLLKLLNQLKLGG